MMDFIREAGWGIYPVLVFGLSMLFVAGKNFVDPHTRHVITAKWLMALTAVAGLLGTATGMQTSAEYIHEIPEKWIFLLGLRESLNNFVGAGVLIVLAMLLMLASHVRNGGAHETRVPATSTT